MEPFCPRLGAAASGQLGKTAPAEKRVSPEPLQGQALPPCDEALAERAINGGCWVELKLEPPCEEDGYEHAGACYLPSWPPMREPRSRR